jgi:hypothetical protein
MLGHTWGCARQRPRLTAAMVARNHRESAAAHGLQSAAGFTMELVEKSQAPEPQARLEQLEAGEAEPITDVAVAVDEAAYLRGWDEAMRAVVAAMQRGGSWKPDDYFDGWMAAVTLQPIDPIRLATTRSRYARGYAAGAKEYELAHRGGYDAE